MIRSFAKFIFLLFFIYPSAYQLKAQSVGGVTSGAATYCSTTNSGFISLSSFTGAILNWESSVDGGSTWTNIGNTKPK